MKILMLLACMLATIYYNNLVFADANTEYENSAAFSYNIDGDMGSIQVDFSDLNLSDDTEAEISALLEGIVNKDTGSLRTALDHLHTIIDDIPLDDEQKAQVHEAIKTAHAKNIIALRNTDSIDMGTGVDWEDLLIPIWAILFSFGTPIAILGIVLYFSYRKYKMRSEIIAKLIDSGQPLSEETIRNLEPRTVWSPLHRGMVNIGLGLALIIALSMLFSINWGALGLIPLFIGIAHLVHWKLGQKNG